MLSVEENWMFKNINLWTITLLSFAVIHAEQSVDEVKKEVITQISSIVQQHKEELPVPYVEKVEKIAQQADTDFSEEFVLKLIDKTVTLAKGSCTPEDLSNLDKSKTYLSDYLKKYQISGIAFTWGFDWAFIYNNQSPCFDVFFKDNEGNVKLRKMQASITSYGGMAKLALQINLIFFVNNNLSYLDVMKEIKLGIGVTSSFLIGGQGMSFTYVPFLNAPGGIVILGYAFGFGDGINCVTAGSLTLVKK
jgi:hypothetical protein